MKKIVYALFLLFFSVCTLAQTQQGYVKTKGRMASNGTVIAGVRLSGVTVQVKGRTAVLSQSNGTFSFPIPSQNYYLQSVQKQGYVLTDPDVLSKQYAYSKNPWVLVLETPNQLADDKLAAERKIRRTLQRQLQEKEDEIESLKVQQKLSEEEYRKQLQDMYALQESNEKLISEMADRYSRLDFDEVNEFNRRISQLILDGKLMEADSMLNTKGDIVARTAILRQHQKANAQEEQEIQKKQKRLEKSKALIQKELEDLAQDCYRKFEIFKMQHQNDSAAYYIEYRANLDTTNVKWQNEAGDYVVNFMADYQLGHNYYKRALLCAQSSGTDQYVLLDCYNNLGLANYFLGNNAIAMDYYMQCFKICHGDSLHLSTIYKNIGNVYYNKGAYDDALSYFKKALELVEKYDAEERNRVAKLYINIGNVYSDQGNFYLAKEYFDKAEVLMKEIGMNKSEDYAGCLLYMGYNYNELEDCDRAMDCFRTALDIFVELYGEHHPYVASAYGGIASSYGRKQDYVKQLECSSQSLSINKSIYGEKHPSIAVTLNNVGMAYLKLEKYDKAIESFLQSLEICKISYGEKYVGVAVIYRNLGFLYKKTGQYDKALDYYLKSLNVAQDLYGEGSQVVQVSVNNLGHLYYEMKNYLMAIRYLKQSLSITEKVFEGNSSKLQSAVKILNMAYQARLKENMSQELQDEFEDFKTKYEKYLSDKK